MNPDQKAFDAVFKPAAVVHASALKPVLDWIFKTVKDLEGRVGDLDGKGESAAGEESKAANMAQMEAAKAKAAAAAALKALQVAETEMMAAKARGDGSAATAEAAWLEAKQSFEVLQQEAKDSKAAYIKAAEAVPGGYPMKEKVADLLEESRAEAEEYKRATDFRLADMEAVMSMLSGEMGKSAEAKAAASKQADAEAAHQQKALKREMEHLARTLDESNDTLYAVKGGHEKLQEKVDAAIMSKSNKSDVEKLGERVGDVETKSTEIEVLHEKNRQLEQQVADQLKLITDMTEKMKELETKKKKAAAPSGGGALDDETIGRIHEHEVMLNDLEKRLHKSEWKVERLDVQTNDATILLRTMDKTVVSLKEEMPRKADKAQIDSLRAGMQQAAVDSFGGVEMPGAGGPRQKVDASRSKDAKFIGGNASEGSGGGAGDAQLRMAVTNLESQLLTNMTIVNEIENRVKGLVDDRKLHVGMTEQWERVLALIGGDEEAVHKLHSRMDSMDLELNIMGTAVHNHEGRIDELENNPFGGSEGTAKRAADAMAEAVATFEKANTKTNQKDVKTLGDKILALGDTVTQAWMCVQELDGKVERSSKRLRTVEDEVEDLSRTVVEHEKAASRANSSWERRRDADLPPPTAGTQATTPAAQQQMGMTMSSIDLDAQRALDDEQDRKLREMEESLRKKSSTDEEQDRMLHQVEAAVHALKDSRTKQEKAIGALEKDNTELRKTFHELDTKVGDLALKLLEAGIAGGSAPGGGANSPTDGDAGDGVSSSEIRNIISILRQDRKTLERVTKEQEKMEERLEGMGAMHARLEGECAQKVDLKDVAGMADKADVDAVWTNIEKLNELVAAKADSGQVEALMRVEAEEKAQPEKLDTSDVYSDEDMQVRVAINSHGELLKHLNKSIGRLSLSITTKAESDQVVMLKSLVEQLRAKVDRPNKAFGAAETNAKADIEALKRNVTNLFKEQRRTDAQQTAEINMLVDNTKAVEAKLAALAEGDITAMMQAGGKKDNDPAWFTGEGPVPETLVKDVASAVKDLFWDRFKKIDGAIKKKVDRGELSMVLAGRGFELPRSGFENKGQQGDNNDFQGVLDFGQPKDGNVCLSCNQELPNHHHGAPAPSNNDSSSSYYVTTAIPPKRVPQQVRKYAGRSLSPVPRASDPNFKLPNI